MARAPLCPATGLPAVRLVQWVSAELLADLWRIEMKVDVRPSFRGATRFGLWESPTGLYFFDPMTAGDAEFYAKFYARLDPSKFPNAEKPRGEFAIAARCIDDGDRVLDVGCGFGAFRHAIPSARYVGLDPHFSGEAESWRQVETLGLHLAANAGTYDAACAFQVLEHVEEPAVMVADMARAVRPGGRVIIAVPHVPSAHTRIPNYLINATPHHLTWWTEKALLAVAARAGLVDARVETAPWTEVDGLVYWMERCSPVKARDRHFRHAWIWHASAAIGFLAGWAMWRIRPRPAPRPGEEGASLVLIAERPDVARGR